VPNQTDDHGDDLDVPDGVVPYPALSFAAVKWLNQRSGGPTGCYPDIPKALTPLFYAEVDQSKPVAVLRTHREQTTGRILALFGTSGGVATVAELTARLDELGEEEGLIQQSPVELLVALCSFAPKQPGPRLINELLCLPEDYERVVGMTTLPGRTPREFETLKRYGMFGNTIQAPPEAWPAS
jgi:hypothetical protein